MMMIMMMMMYVAYIEATESHCRIFSIKGTFVLLLMRLLSLVNRIENTSVFGFFFLNFI